MKTTTAFPLVLLFLFAILVTTPIPSTAKIVKDENSKAIRSNGGPYYFLSVTDNYYGLQVAKVQNDASILSVVESPDGEGMRLTIISGTESNGLISTDQLVNIEFVGIGSKPSHWEVGATEYVQVGYDNENPEGLFKVKQAGQIGEGYHILYCPDSDSDDTCRHLTLVSADGFNRLALGDTDNSWRVVFRPAKSGLTNTCRCPQISTV